MSRALLLEARAKICSSIVNQYGSTEAGSTAYAMADQLTDTEGATGYVVPGAQVEIVGEGGEQRPPGSEGIVRIRAAWQAQPFPPQATSDFSDGWFYPGDRGHLTNDGLLILSGRTSDVINAGGLKLAPDVIEEVVLSHPNVADAGAFGHMGTSGIEEIHVAIVPRAPLSEQHLIEWCAERNLPVTRIYLVDTLPKTALGKIQRNELKRLLQN
jgi:acyl-coenzyme A synthetase/AMP-(fatty) acid ligase